MTPRLRTIQFSGFLSLEKTSLLRSCPLPRHHTWLFPFPTLLGEVEDCCGDVEFFSHFFVQQRLNGHFLRARASTSCGRCSRGCNTGTYWSGSVAFIKRSTMPWECIKETLDLMQGWKWDWRVSLEKVTLNLNPQGQQELAREKKTFTDAQIQENCWMWRETFSSTCEVCGEAQTSFCGRQGAIRTHSQGLYVHVHICAFRRSFHPEIRFKRFG